MSRTYKISVLPGDGIGREVIPQAVRILECIEEQVQGFRLELHKFECGGEYYLQEKREWSLEAEEFTKSEADAVLLGAIGALDVQGNDVRLPDGNLAGYNVVIGLRMQLDLFANVRPVKLYEGIWTPLAQKTSKDIDMTIIRENTEGLYSPTRGILSRGNTSELAIDARVITRVGSERVIRYAFELAKKSLGAPSDGAKRVTCVDKSNLLAGCQLFRGVFKEIGAEYPDVEKDFAYVDAWTQWCLKKPEYYNVVVAPNEFGDIITDLGAAIQGGLGVAPAGNIGIKHGVFEPVHGSAPKYYGSNSANPTAATLASSMMLTWLGEKYHDKRVLKAAELINKAVAEVLREGKVRTQDLCVGPWAATASSSTDTMATAFIDAIKKHAKGS